MLVMFYSAYFINQTLHIYICNMNIMLFHVILVYSLRYYLRFHATAVGFGTYYPWTGVCPYLLFVFI